MTDRLDTRPRLADADRLYAELIDLHRGLNEDQSHQLNARLILLLANQVGDTAIVREAMATARTGLGE